MILYLKEFWKFLYLSFIPVICCCFCAIIAALCHFCALASIANISYRFFWTRKMGFWGSCNYIHLQNNNKGRFTALWTLKTKNPKSWKHSQALSRWAVLFFFLNSWMLANQMDWKMFYFRLSAVCSAPWVDFAGISSALGAPRETLSLWWSHPSLLIHVNTLNPHSYLCLLPLSLSFTIHVMFAQFTTQQVFPLLTLKGQVSSWKNLSPRITTKSAHQAQIRLLCAAEPEVMVWRGDRG